MYATSALTVLEPGFSGGSADQNWSIIDSLSAHVALLDVSGNIVAVNEAWRTFADGNESRLPAYGVGCNYLELLSRVTASAKASAEDARIASEVQAGIRAILLGSSEKFELEYPCHAPREERWFLLTVTPSHQQGRVQAVITHENITSHKQSEVNAQRQAARLAATFSSMVDAIALAIEKRDPYTAGHQRQVATLAVEIGRLMGLDETRLFGLHLGSTIHDIGKISIPAEILNRPGALSEPERSIICAHPAVGQEILGAIDFPWPIADMVSQHHERLDGSGYPLRLTGDQICLEARIIAVADVFDAIVSHRPYRPGRSIEEAVQELAGGRGTKYDSQVVDAGLLLFPHVDAEWHETHRNLPGDFQHLME